MVSALPSGYAVEPVEFEKDDDTNFHMDVIAGLANLRARNYGIQEVEKFKCKLIAGRIVPAIATATALATGLVCLELYKVVHHVDKPGHCREEKTIEAFKNTFANLALPLFAIAEPMPSKSFQYKDLKWSIWDRWILEGDLTVQEVIDWFSDKGLEAYSISCGSALLYNNIFPKHKERLGKKMSELVTTVAKVSPVLRTFSSGSPEAFIILATCTEPRICSLRSWTFLASSISTWWWRARTRTARTWMCRLFPSSSSDFACVAVMSISFKTHASVGKAL